MIHPWDPTEKQGSPLFLYRDSEKGGLSPTTWIPNWLFNTNQPSFSSYLGLGIYVSQTSIFHDIRSIKEIRSYGLQM